MTFGTPGLGGQIGFADPKNKLGVGFTSNYYSMTGTKDHRFLFLESAIYKVIRKMEEDAQTNQLGNVPLVNV